MSEMSEMSEINYIETEKIGIVLKERKERKESKERIMKNFRWNIVMKDKEGSILLDKNYKSHLDMMRCEENPITSRQVLYYYLKGIDVVTSGKRNSKYNIKIIKLNKIENIKINSFDEKDSD